MKKVLCLILVTMMVCAANVEAGSHGKGGGQAKEDWASMIMMKAHCLISHQEELQLSDEQVAKIKDLKYNIKKALISKDAEIELVAVDIKQAMWQDAIDIAAVNALVDKKYALKNEKAKMLVAACAQLQSILTDEQKKELKQLKKKIKCKA